MIILEMADQERKWMQQRVAVATLADQKAVESARKMAKDFQLENQRQVQDRKEQRYSKLENMYSDVEMKPFVKN